MPESSGWPFLLPPTSPTIVPDYLHIRLRSIGGSSDLGGYILQQHCTPPVVYHGSEALWYGESGKKGASGCEVSSRDPGAAPRHVGG